MRRLFLFIPVFCLMYSQHSYGDEILDSLSDEASISAENAMLEIEKELLSLEDDLLNTETALLLPEENILSPASENPEITQNLELLTTSIEEPLIEQQQETPLFTENDNPLSSAASTLIEVEAPSVTLPPAIPERTPTLSTPPLSSLQVNFKQVFAGSPFIYFILFSMSFFSVAICLYALLRIKQQTSAVNRIATEVRGRLLANDFSSAAQACHNRSSLFSNIIGSGLACRKHGLQAMMETMRAEGKRSSLSFWQQIGLLQDIAIIAPMLGLLGTVIGLFYAFYDLNRSFESINNLLDGLGISVGTTVAGIGVAILSLILHSMAKFRLIRALAKVETEATSLAYLMDEKN